MHRWPLRSSDVRDRDHLRGVEGFEIRPDFLRDSPDAGGSRVGVPAQRFRVNDNEHGEGEGLHRRARTSLKGAGLKCRSRSTGRPSGPRSGPAAGRGVAFGRRERQPFIQAGSSAAGAMSAWPDSAARGGRARSRAAPSGAVADRILHPAADLHARLVEAHRRAAAAGDHGQAGRRRQSHRHTSRRWACRLRTRRPNAHGMPARRPPLGMPRRSVSAIHAVTASAAAASPP